MASEAAGWNQAINVFCMSFGGADGRTNLKRQTILSLLRCLHRMQRLADWAPKSCSRVLSLLPRLDRLAATSARVVCPPIHPKSFLRIRTSSCSPHPDVSDDLIARRFGHVGKHVFSSLANQPSHFVIAQSLHRAERVNSASETNLGFKNIAQPCHERLRQQSFAHLQVAATAQTCN